MKIKFAIICLIICMICQPVVAMAISSIEELGLSPEELASFYELNLSPEAVSILLDAINPFPVIKNPMIESDLEGEWFFYKVVAPIFYGEKWTIDFDGFIHLIRIVGIEDENGEDITEEFAEPLIAAIKEVFASSTLSYRNNILIYEESGIRREYQISFNELISSGLDGIQVFLSTDGQLILSPNNNEFLIVYSRTSTPTLDLNQDGVINLADIPLLVEAGRTEEAVRLLSAMCDES